MGEIIGGFYTSLFEEWYGENLANYLWGEASPLQSGNMFITFFILVVISSIVLAALYYLLIDRPRWANLIGWGVTLLINFCINFVIGWQRILYDFDAGLMIDANEHPLDITTADCLAFGGTNAILAIVVFFILSLPLKYLSKASSHVPF